MMRYEHVVQNQDLARNVYCFVGIDRSNGVAVVLSEYRFETRQTKRHGWKTLERWNIYSQRDSNCERPSDELRNSPEIIEAALRNIRDMVQYSETLR